MPFLTVCRASVSGPDGGQVEPGDGVYAEEGTPYPQPSGPLPPAPPVARQSFVAVTQ